MAASPRSTRSWRSSRPRGKIREYGVSLDWQVEVEMVVETTKSKALEVYYNALYQEPRGAFAQAQESGVGLIVKVPLDSGWLSGRYRGDSHFDRCACALVARGDRPPWRAGREVRRAGARGHLAGACRAPVYAGAPGHLHHDPWRKERGAGARQLLPPPTASCPPRSFARDRRACGRTRSRATRCPGSAIKQHVRCLLRMLARGLQVSNELTLFLIFSCTHSIGLPLVTYAFDVVSSSAATHGYLYLRLIDILSPSTDLRGDRTAQSTEDASYLAPAINSVLGPASCWATLVPWCRAAICWSRLRDSAGACYDRRQDHPMHIASRRYL